MSYSELRQFCFKPSIPIASQVRAERAERATSRSLLVVGTVHPMVHPLNRSNFYTEPRSDSLDTFPDTYRTLRTPSDMHSGQFPDRSPDSHRTVTGQIGHESDTNRTAPGAQMSNASIGQSGQSGHHRTPSDTSGHHWTPLGSVKCKKKRGEIGPCS